MGGESEEELLARASGGDSGAVEELLERHLGGLRAFVARNAGALPRAKESKADLVQSVCREVLQDAGRFEYRGEEAFRQWLYNAALRKIIDRQRYWRAGRRDVGREDPAAGAAGAGTGEFTPDQLRRISTGISTPSGAAVVHEEAERIAQALDRLSNGDRRVIRLIYVEELSHAQAAERLGCSEVASRKLLSRALMRLAKEYGA